MKAASLNNLVAVLAIRHAVPHGSSCGKAHGLDPCMLLAGFSDQCRDDRVFCKTFFQLQNPPPTSQIQLSSKMLLGSIMIQHTIATMASLASVQALPESGPGD